MWACDVEPLLTREGVRLSVRERSRHVSYAELIDALALDRTRADAFSECLASLPFPAFFWETRPVCASNADDAFECVVLPAPALARVAPDTESFAEHFRAVCSVVRFENLGGDATLIVPCPRAEASAYPHLAAFLRQAPREQREALWSEVGRAARESLGPEPFWLSTSGLGVAWVHVRLDARPKYYQYTPYRQHPYGAPGASR